MKEHRKIRVLQINKLYYPHIGGIERVVQQIAEGLKDEVDMRVLVCNTGKKTVRENIHGVSVTRAGSLAMKGSLPVSFKFLKEFRRQAKESDVLLFHMPYPIGDLAYLLSGIRDKKIILWWHSDVVRQKRLMFLYRPLMEWFLKRADKIIVATPGHIEGSHYLKPYRDKCVIVPYGIPNKIIGDASKFERAGQNEPIHEKTCFLFVGRLVYYKGCDVLLKAFRSVHDAELVIVGTGPLESELKRLVEEYGMIDRVHFKRDLSDQQIMKEYQKCDVFVLPAVARSEAFGLVQIEAMAYGKPVINTALPSGVPYVSIHNVTGLTVEPNHAEQLGDAMNWMVEHPAERMQMGERACQRVKEEYQESTMIERVMGALQL